ncbi:restriction endonuclease subunit S [Limosilactobacillus fermentum]|uniref:restriction endonuclease subunit S n=1 Tax=Limosilactobacillus fermentum TaxID=1613 RepID=UPI001EDBB730|nr:restriction endonuclease subunit S [Limosilactobacillus fermentum]
MMVDKKRKVPNLRFKGFTNDWVQRNLGEVVQKVKSYSLSRDVETEDDTGFEYIHYGDIHTQKADVIDGNTKLPSIVPGDYDLVQVGDVIVADASEDYLGIAEPAVVVNKPTQNLVAGLHTIAIRPNGIHPLFLYYLLHTQLFKHFGYRTGTGLKVFSISYPNLAKFTFAMPTLDEQEAIANTLRDMDNLIAANQRKLDLLKEQKKGYLQKMFPKNGSKFPQLRFAGFADAWEQRKIGNYFTERSERSSNGELVSVTINSGVVKASTLDRKDNSSKNKSNYKKVEIGDIAYNSMRMWQGASGYSPYSGILSPAYTVITSKDDVDSKFFAYQFKKHDMIQIFQRNSQGLTSDTWNLKFPSLKSIKVAAPAFDEQKRIATFLEEFDHLITLHQRKLEKLQELKKGYLQKMFI